MPASPTGPLPAGLTGRSRVVLGCPAALLAPSTLLMCGIAAAFDRTGRGVDLGALLATRDRMAPRGPDGEGLWTDPDRRAALAHRRLAIQDLSGAGAQPMASTDGRRIVAFNGEIYNVAALRATLEADGAVFRSASDTEVLLHLYDRHGDALVHRLRGMFAFALWDADRAALLLARDPYGIKPLYVADDGRSVHVASQVRALLAGGGVDTAPDPAGHVGFFLWGHVPEPHTLYRGIRALPAGHTLWVDASGPHAPRPFATVPGTLRDAAPADTAPDLHAALLDSVRHHLVADVPVGVFLSAGRDSTTLAALAAEAGGTLRTVTLGFEEYAGTPHDEVPLAEAVARHYGADHRTVRVTRHDFASAREHVLEQMDQPTLDGLNTYFVSRAAAEAGLKVALSGVGGDELFGGYPAFREIPRLVGALGPVPGVARVGRSLRAVSAPLVRRMTSPKYAGLLEYGSTYGGAYLLRRGLFMPWELPDVLGPDLARDGWAALQPVARLDETVRGLASDRARVTALESVHYMRNQLLRDTDWAGMAHGLEIRAPLVDWTLLRTLAPALNGSSPPSKADLAATARPALPPALLTRPKTGFTVPVRDWMLADSDVPVERGLRGWARAVHGQFAPTTALAA